MLRFDVVILGGGPAGCAVTLSLLREAPSLSVAILENSGYDSRRIGETLPPDIEGLLTHLGILHSFRESDAIPAYSTRACWGSETLVENEFVFRTQGKGWQLDRLAFDRMMASAAEHAGTRLFTKARVTAHERASAGWRLSVQTPDGLLPLECRFVVNATGRNSSFAVQQGAKHIEYDRLAGCFQFFEAAVANPDPHTLVEAFEHGWIYSAGLPDGSFVAAILTDTDILRHIELSSAAGWLRVLDQTPETRKRLQGSQTSGEPLTRSAASRQLDIVAQDAWIAVGDAASTFDPLSSQGIHKAIRGGIFASYAILDALRGGETDGWSRYERFVRDEYNEYMDVRGAYYDREQRWSGAPFWKRRHERVTLDPFRMLQAFPNGSSHACMHLTPGEVEMIRKLCSQPRPAHQVVRELIAGSRRPVTERRAVLAVQELLGAGLVVALPPETQ